MATNNFKLFDEKKANMMTDEEYAINQQRLNGVQSGVASSQLQNKTLYQTALMCYALAQLMAANGYDANDANAVSTFVNNLSLSMVQKVVDKASANDVANKVAGKWVDAKQLGELKTDVADNYLPLLGGTMLGDLILHGAPVSDFQAATKQYVDTKIGAGGNNVIATWGTYVGNGGYGSSKPNSIAVPFKPIILFVPHGHLSSVTPSLFQTAELSGTYQETYFGAYSNKVRISNNIIQWYSNSAQYQMNENGEIYYYAIFGYQDS